MQLITDDYLKLNSQLHIDNPNYGVTGKCYLEPVMELAIELKTQDILDYGCGKSTLALNLPFAIKQYDPAIPKYAAPPREADIVVCTDVLEHIEPACLDTVLDHIHSLTRKAVFFSGCTVPAKKTLADGRNAHLIVKSARWWLDQLWDRFELISFNRFQNNFTAILYKREALSQPTSLNLAN
jgi:hypothetical protein